MVLTRAQIAQRFGVSEDTIDRLRVRHGVPVLMLGRLVRFDDRAIAALESACRTTAEPARVPLVSASASAGRVPRQASGLEALRERLKRGAKGRG